MTALAIIEVPLRCTRDMHGAGYVARVSGGANAYIGHGSTGPPASTLRTAFTFA